jgi:2-polyprenyl-6-methoxyphenol hydroxylase-like FAD-dependent oxidoreductase
MRIGTRAVVLGGSMAGLCAAGAVAPFVDEVVVLERDLLPVDAEHRRGVPQSKHPHFLLNSGRRAIEKLFPGYEDALIAAGALHLNASMYTAHCEPGGWLPRKAGSMTMLYSSRILMERVLRDQVRKIDNITLREQVDVRGLVFDHPGTPGGRVVGVRMLADSDTGEEILCADLVIDSLGRGSGVSDWLVAAGWAPVSVQTLDAKASYSSRWYERPTGADTPDEWWWQMMSVLPVPEHAPDHPVEHEYLCIVFPIEANKVIICMGSWGHPMPRKLDAFETAALRIRTPAFGKAMQACAPLHDDIHFTRSTGNKWRRYDQLRDYPLGLVCIGDSICAFNPLYGQGMSSAAHSALVLNDLLRSASSVDRAFHSRFLAAQRESLLVPWTLALARDRGYDHAEGTEVARPWQRRLVGRYSWSAFNLISSAARDDAVIEEHFAKVFNLDESITEFARNPRVILGLVWHAIKTKLGRVKYPVTAPPEANPPSHDQTSGNLADYSGILQAEPLRATKASSTDP